MEIILDTNFLLIPEQLKVDIFAEIEKIATFKYQLCVLDKTIDELNKIIDTQKGKYRRYAKIGLELIKHKKVKVLKTETLKNVDELIIEYSKQGQTIVATQDLELKRALQKKGVQIICLRQKNHLIIQ